MELYAGVWRRWSMRAGGYKLEPASERVVGIPQE